MEPAPIMISSADVTDIDDDVIDDDEFEPPGFRVQGAKGKKPVKKLYNNTKKLIVGPAGNLSNFQNLFGNSITISGSPGINSVFPLNYWKIKRK